MIDHGHQHAHHRGNIGAGITLGILDIPPFDRHEIVMSSIVSRVAPGVRLMFGAAESVDPSGMARLIDAGCSVIAMPFVIPGGPYGLWPTACHVAASNGILLFAATGNGTPETAYPASDPTVFACGRVSGTDGQPIPTGSSAAGRLNVGLVSGDTMSSGASVMAACVACLWLGYAVHRYPPSHRPAEFWAWLGRTGWPIPGRSGYAPDCRRLSE
jgi:hypothetical protein